MLSSVGFESSYPVAAPSCWHTPLFLWQSQQLEVCVQAAHYFSLHVWKYFHAGTLNNAEHHKQAQPNNQNIAQFIILQRMILVVLVLTAWQTRGITSHSHSLFASILLFPSTVNYYTLLESNFSIIKSHLVTELSFFSGSLIPQKPPGKQNESRSWTCKTRNQWAILLNHHVYQSKNGAMTNPLCSFILQIPRLFAIELKTKKYFHIFSIWKCQGRHSCKKDIDVVSSSGSWMGWRRTIDQWIVVNNSQVSGIGIYSMALWVESVVLQELSDGAQHAHSAVSVASLGCPKFTYSQTQCEVKFLGSVMSDCALKCHVTCINHKL